MMPAAAAAAAAVTNAGDSEFHPMTSR